MFERLAFFKSLESCRFAITYYNDIFVIKLDQLKSIYRYIMQCAHLLFVPKIRATIKRRTMAKSELKFSEIMDDTAHVLFGNSERSDECINFTMIITSRNNAPISNYGGGFRCKSEYPWCIIEVKSKHFPTVFKKIEKNKKKKKNDGKRDFLCKTSIRPNQFFYMVVIQKLITVNAFHQMFMSVLSIYIPLIMIHTAPNSFYYLEILSNLSFNYKVCNSILNHSKIL
ncbi:Uncharacterized protein FWK35_00020709 [Aphis craccivora]|uniref:Uncharacterized protein n=1 Tax=Aphis craccivora TaxID=307492 RepID=A0A6G0ZJG6_APHCR|nr:Uncharacterized protein FWK35_00020709 [Aphis craccivora]